MATKTKLSVPSSPYSIKSRYESYIITDGDVFDPDLDMAQQQFKDDSDINIMIAKGLRYEPDETRVPNFVDTTQTIPYYEAVQQVQEAQENFMLLDSKVRRRFNNDPGELLKFLDTPDNREEAEFLGLVPKIEKNPEKPPVVPIETLQAKE